LAVRVISVISEGLFFSQKPEYIKNILPDNIPRFGLSAGLPVTLQTLVGDQGRVIGLESFGYSAPAEVLDQKLGYTADTVFEQVVEFLKEIRS
ncbi:MAG: transketolase, partial [Rhodothermaceae bacterium]|nr:transketolase [Rhodothermaceae bacterium]